MKIKILLATIALGMITFSCTDSEETPVIDTEEVADLVGSSLASSSSGVNQIAEDVANDASSGVANAGGRTLECGVEEMASYERTSSDGSAISYDYALVYTYLLSCSQLGVPQSFEAGLTYTGEFESTRVKSSNSGSGDLTVTALDRLLTTFEINGTFIRNGSFESKVRNLTKSTSKIEMTLVGVTVSKTTQQITGGTATVKITGTVTGKGDFTKEVTVTFLGNKQGEIQIGEAVYTVNLTTGEVVKK